MHSGKSLGKGKFSYCIECIDIDTRQKYALKCLKTCYKIDRIKWLTHEYQIMNELDHINVLKTFGMSEKCYHSILLELCNGTLDDYLDINEYSTSLLKEEEVIDIFKQIVEGMDHIHSRGIIHRDISLGNILMTSENIVKISDFGLAKFENEVETGKVMCGSTDYMSPEMLKGDTVTSKADIWALGVILFRLIFGNLPFHCEDKEETKKKN